MLLALDVGNTEITIGLFTGDRLDVKWRLVTGSARTPDEWTATLTSLITQAGISPAQINAAVEASVAPAVTVVLAEGVEKAVGVRPTSVGPGSGLPIVLDVDEPLTVGADRVVNTLAAARLYQRDTIVVDFGTATSFDCITKEGTFLGGVIAPGLSTAADNLTRRAAKLPATELVVPKQVIGKRTEDCIRAGVLFGATDSVDGIVRRIKAEWPGAEVPLVVATGGLVGMIAPLSSEIEKVEQDLTLRGLCIAAAELEIGNQR